MTALWSALPKWLGTTLLILSVVACHSGERSSLPNPVANQKAGGEGYGGEGLHESVTRKAVDEAVDQLILSRRRMARGIGLDIIRSAGEAVKLSGVLQTQLAELRTNPAQRVFSADLLLNPILTAALDSLFLDPVRLKAQFHPVPGPLTLVSPDGVSHPVTMRWKKDTNQIEVDMHAVFAMLGSDQLDMQRQVLEQMVGHELIHLADLLGSIPVDPEDASRTLSHHIEDFLPVGRVFAGSNGGQFLLNVLSLLWTLHLESTRDDWRHDAVAAVVNVDRTRVRLLNEHLQELWTVDVPDLGSLRPNVTVVGYAVNGSQRIAVAPESSDGVETTKVQFFDYDFTHKCRPAGGNLSELAPYGAGWFGPVRLSAFSVAGGIPMLMTGAGAHDANSGAHVKLWAEKNGQWETRASFMADTVLNVGVQVAIGMGPFSPMLATALNNRIRLFDPATQVLKREFVPYPGQIAKFKIAWVNGLLVTTPVKDGSRHFRTFDVSDSASTEATLKAERLPEDEKNAGVHPHTVNSASLQRETLLLEDMNTGKACLWDSLTWTRGACTDLKF